MFQIIIGVLLGLILLFVIFLLVTELTATYPVWKQFSGGILPGESSQQTLKGEEKTNSRILLLVLFCLLAFCIIALIISSLSKNSEHPSMVQGESAIRPQKRATKILTTQTADGSLQFSLHLKWDEGKLYVNNTITFPALSAPTFSDWRFYLLDRDGFLIKELSFTQNEFVYQASKGNQPTVYLTKFNEDLLVEEFEKIYKLQVVADRKLLTTERISP